MAAAWLIDPAKVNQYPDIDCSNPAIHVSMQYQTRFMKVIVVFVMVFLLLGACGPKAYYKTGEGKKKQKYYNDIQYGNDPHPKKKF